MSAVANILVPGPGVVKVVALGRAEANVRVVPVEELPHAPNSFILWHTTSAWLAKQESCPKTNLQHVVEGFL